MYSDLRNKIYEAVKTTSGLNNRFYFAEAPQNPGLTPYAVFYFINQDTNRYDSEKITEDFIVQINLFSEEKTTAKTIENVAEGILSNMDALKNTLAVTGYTVLDYQRDFVIPAQKNEGFWRLSIQYTIKLIN